MAQSVLQPWVMELPLREQGTLLTCVRGCDLEPKTWTRTGVAYSPGRRLTAFIRWCFMVPADSREVDSEEGAFMMSKPPGWVKVFSNPVDGVVPYEWKQFEKFKPSEFGHLPQHWYSHAMHALEVIGYRHPNLEVRGLAFDLYSRMVHNMHLNIETRHEMSQRLTEDRVENKTVVS